jgi:hypothetical protein
MWECPVSRAETIKNRSELLTLMIFVTLSLTRCYRPEHLILTNSNKASIMCTVRTNTEVPQLVEGCQTSLVPGFQLLSHPRVGGGVSLFTHVFLFHFPLWVAFNLWVVP